jgi:hypothetical protein
MTRIGKPDANSRKRVLDQRHASTMQLEKDKGLFGGNLIFSIFNRNGAQIWNEVCGAPPYRQACQICKLYCIMRFLAPFRYVAFELPFHIPYQSGALVYMPRWRLLVIWRLHTHRSRYWCRICKPFSTAFWHCLLHLACPSYTRIPVHCGRRCNSTTAPTGGGWRCRKRRSQRGRWPRRLH